MKNFPLTLYSVTVDVVCQPWRVLYGERNSDTQIMANDDYFRVAVTGAANTRLIAVAPDLLAMVKDIANLDHVGLAHGDKELLESLRAWKAEARAAIAKAEGR